jgi:hypothetical protein
MAGHCRHASAFGSFSMSITNGCSVGCGRSWPVSAGMLAPYVLLCNTVPPLAATPAQQPPPLFVPRLFTNRLLCCMTSAIAPKWPHAPQACPLLPIAQQSVALLLHTSLVYFCVTEDRPAFLLGPLLSVAP